MRAMNAWVSVPTGNGAVEVARRSRRRIAGVAITGLVAATFAAGVVAPAQAALPGPVGGTDEVNGFPLSYSDGDVVLGQCLSGPQCVGDIERPNPAAPVSYPDNFPIEQFWFAAFAATPTQPGLYEAGLEGAYLETTGTPPKGVAGSEVGFGRIRIILDNVDVGGTYTIQHPYGIVTVTDGGDTDEIAPDGVIRITIDNGCLVTPCNVAGPTGFDAAAAAFLGNVAGNPPSTFLRQENTVPGFIGDLLNPGPVTGGPGGNVVTVTGPNINPGGVDVNTLTATDFGVSGKIADVPVAPSAPLTPTVTTGNDSALVGWTAPSNGGSPMTTYSVQAFSATGAPVGAPQIVPAARGTRANSLNVTGLTTGTKFAFEVTATNAIGSAVSARSAVVIPGTPNQQYVGRVYYDLFNRAPDAGGLTAWTNRLNAGTPRVAVANAITSSPEYRSKLITGLYAKYLAGRAPDAAGLNFWLAMMNSGFTVSRIEAGFLTSNEYFVKAGSSNLGWVTAVYNDVFPARTPSAGELNFWTGRLNAGVSRGQVAMDFLLSTERLTTVVGGYYTQLLGRGLDPAGLVWVKILQSGARDETVIGGIIASTEYFAKKI